MTYAKDLGFPYDMNKALIDEILLNIKVREGFEETLFRQMNKRYNMDE